MFLPTLAEASCWASTSGLAHCGVRWKLLANPTEGVLASQGKLTSHWAVPCAHPQDAGQDCSGILCICSNLSNLEQQKLIFHVSGWRGSGITEFVDLCCLWIREGRFGFCLYQLIVVPETTSFLLRSLWSHSSLTSSMWMCHLAFSWSYNTGYLIKMLNGITDTKAVFQMRLWSHVLGNGM